MTKTINNAAKINAVTGDSCTVIWGAGPINGKDSDHCLLCITIQVTAADCNVARQTLQAIERDKDKLVPPFSKTTKNGEQCNCTQLDSQDGGFPNSITLRYELMHTDDVYKMATAYSNAFISKCLVPYLEQIWGRKIECEINKRHGVLSQHFAVLTAI